LTDERRQERYDFPESTRYDWHASITGTAAADTTDSFEEAFRYSMGDDYQDG
jgi:hypothetical protein